MSEHGAAECRADAAGVGAGRRWPASVPVAAVVAAVMLGPVLGPGSLLNLDMVAVDHWPFPRSFWGIGPELPRLGPIEVVISAVAALTSGATAVKLLLAVSLIASYSGTVRLVLIIGPRRGPAGLSSSELLIAAHAAALLYSTSPYFLTRMAVGHLSMVTVYALLPWTIRVLFRPSRQLQTTVFVLLAFGCMGFYGAMVAVLCLAAGLVAEHRSDTSVRLAGVAGALVVTQLLWLPASLAVLAAGVDLRTGDSFTEAIDSPLDALQLLGGLGFWQPLLQVGGDGGLHVVLAGVVLAGLAIVGSHAMQDRSWTWPATWCAVGALAVVVAASTPGLARVVDLVTALPGGAALREPQRLLPLYLLPMAVGAPIGAIVAARRAGSVWRPALVLIPFMAALVLGAPGVWGIHQRLEPVTLPSAWAVARDVVTSDPGTVLVLPWHRYLDVAAAEDRRTLNPAIRYFGPEVIVANDLGDELSQGRETADARIEIVEPLLEDLRAGVPVAAELADAGVTWVLITHDADYLQYLPILADPGVTLVLSEAAVDLVRIDAGWGAARAEDGSRVASTRRLGPLVRFDGTEALAWSAASPSGWRRGGAAASMLDGGSVLLTGGSRTAIHWPGLFVIGGYFAAFGAGVTAWRARTRRRRAIAPNKLSSRLRRSAPM